MGVMDVSKGCDYEGQKREKNGLGARKSGFGREIPGFWGGNFGRG